MAAGLIKLKQQIKCFYCPSITMNDQHICRVSEAMQKGNYKGN